MKKIFSAFLALLMLVSNIGFSMNTHFCAGKVVKKSLFIGLHIPDCGMPEMEKSCENEPANHPQFSQKPCCENQHVIHQLEEDTKLQASSESVNPTFLVAFVQALVLPLLSAHSNLIDFKEYPSPPPNKELRVLFQTFLI